MKLKITEIAQRFDLNADTLERWIRQGRIPVKKVGDLGVFNEGELTRWATKQRLSFGSTEKQEQEEKKSSAPMLSSAMKRGGCYHLVSGTTKEEVIQSAVELTPDLSGLSKDELYRQLMERELMTSTGIGKEVAIPHPRNPLKDSLEEPMIITCFLENAIDFSSIDDRPVFILFLLLSPTIEHHLGLLSRLSFCLRDNEFVDFLKKAPTSDRFYEKIEAMETTIEYKGI